MIVKKLIVGQLKANCYLVFHNNNKKATIIDPGDDADYIQRIIFDLELKPIKIIATHGHFDHILAVNELKHAFNIPFLMHKKDEFLLSQMRSSCKFFTGFDPGPAPKIDKYLTGHGLISKIEIIETPGHTPGGISLYIEKDKVLLCGDLIFKEGVVGRTDFVYSRKKDLEKSVEKIFKLQQDTLVYPGHGEEFLISDFKQNNTKI
ncbi:hypothetical protein A2Z22_04635 [Candidatus Woesebacteria bacterium RBG_16_34_12]|uniref:Metallo-beta-lactamase domain-containing protein n=1 Tax=Candidatus Woesebacteria bacterium RBG_16_34_12 TaxID=1802480 RepID=A0A1F7XDE6_9BACT|nr:MAG: hypothetical protein A2Z22_04635 [Candidatus Woesebacteria bacterium RBG_16_34_12]